MLTESQINALQNGEKSPQTEAIVQSAVAMLSSSDVDTRQRGYELFDQIVKQCLYGSCLHYGSLLGSFEDPIKGILTQTIEAWAGRPDRRQPDERRNAGRNPSVDEVGSESFPASDPPAWTAARVGSPIPSSRSQRRRRNDRQPS